MLFVILLAPQCADEPETTPEADESETTPEAADVRPEILTYECSTSPQADGSTEIAELPLDDDEVPIVAWSCAWEQLADGTEHTICSPISVWWYSDVVESDGFESGPFAEVCCPYPGAELRVVVR